MQSRFVDVHFVEASSFVHFKTSKRGAAPEFHNSAVAISARRTQWFD
jgi:hypothetical protein